MIFTQQKRFLIVPVLVLIGIIVGLAIFVNFDTQQISLAEKSRVPPESQKELDRISDALSRLAAAVTPSVVSVSTTQIADQQEAPPEELYNNPFSKKNFNEPAFPDYQNDQFPISALGSGIIVSSNGHILTNNHTIDGVQKIVITLQDKRIFIAKLIGTDPKSDLALLKINADDLPALAMNDKYNLRVGELVVAVGISFDLRHTVTMGIVSAVGRSQVGIVDYEDFIQTDAAINSGSSGGALVNSSGELVGINTDISSTSGGNMGGGFAIPVKTAKTVMDTLIKYGKVIRGWLGVSIQNITPEIAVFLGLKKRSGVLINDVFSDSPGEKAGLLQGDIIVEFNANPIQDVTDLKNQIAAASPGSTVNITVIRNKDKKELKVVLGEVPENIDRDATNTSDPRYLYGAHLQDLTPELRSQMSLPETMEGVLVDKIENNSPADDSLLLGDVITQVNRKNISNMKELQNTVKNIKDRQNILLLVSRYGGSLFVTLTP